MKKSLKELTGLIVAFALATLLFLYWPLYQRSVPKANNDAPVDVVLIGGGIMSVTLGTYLQELQPDWKIELSRTPERHCAVKARTAGTTPAQVIPHSPN